MRKLLGGLVLVAGVGGLGWYGSSNNAKTMQAEITDAAAANAQTAIHAVNTRVSGRDIIVSGIANDEGERDLILSAMNEINGRRVVRDELRVLDTASPFALNAIKNADGTTYNGSIPTETDRAVLTSRIGDQAGELELMAGVPDENWIGTVGAGLDALDELQDGTLSVSDKVVTLKGIALTPVEENAANAALSDLPEGYSADVVITTLDDGTPLRLTMEKSAEGSVATGKLPKGLSVSDLGAAYGSDIDAEIQQGVLTASNSDWIGATQQGTEGLALLEDGKLMVTEDALSLTGSATPSAKAEAEALIASLPESMNATSDISLYDDGEPFSLMMKSADNQLSASGKFPAGVNVSDVVGDAPADIETAYINDETGHFAPVVMGGVKALSALENGELSVVGTDVTLTGLARTPAEADAAKAALADLPDGYSASIDLQTLDDGTPPKFTVNYDASGAVSVDGKLPAGTSLADIGDALGTNEVSGEPTVGLVGDGTPSLERLNALSSWLPELETMTFESDDTAMTVDAVVAPGTDSELVAAGISDALGNGASVTVSEPTTLPADGTERVNRFNGRTEIFTDGYWLPVFDFASNQDTCGSESAAALQTDKVNFVTGSDRLDAQSIRAINAVAAIMQKCLNETDLSVEIGGHTDSQGGDDLNLQLSQSRAEAVRSALLRRGLAEARISAKGYGEAQPIADNETAEGRAANRRTTITWFAPEIEETPVVEETSEDTATPIKEGE